ncbi:MAG: PilN domain-containing protein [Bacillota bacterium]
MSALKKIKNYLVIDESYLQFIQNQREIVVNEYFSWEKEDDFQSYLNNVSGKIKSLSLLIPAHKLFFYSFTLPKKALKKVEEIIDINFLSKLSVDKEKLYYSYYIDEDYLNSNENGSEEKAMILVFAVKKGFIDKIYNICKQSRIKVGHILPFPLLAYLYHREESLKKINLSSDEVPLFVDSFSEIQNFIMFNEKDLYIRGSKGGYDVLEDEMRKFYFYATNISEGKDPLIFFNGRKILENVFNNGFSNEEFSMEFQEMLDTPFDPDRYTKEFFRSVGRYKYQENMDFKEQMPMFQSKKKQKSTALIRILIILIVLANITTFYFNWQMKEERLLLLQSKAEVVNQEVEEVNIVKNQYSQKRDRLNTFRNLLHEHKNGYLPWLIELTDILPENVEIINLSFGDNQLAMLQGTADSARSVIAALESSDYFTNLSFRGSIQTGQEIEQFRIVGDLVNESE